MSEPILIFTHIPKAAGTTMTEIIRSEFRAREILNRDKMSGAEWTEQLRAVRPEVRVIVGHARYGAHVHVSRPCRYFTILRDPIERAFSFYSYIRATPAHRLHDDVVSGRLGLIECLRQNRNLQTKFIAGSTAPAAGDIDDTDFELARQNLEHEYEVFGLAEEFAKSVLLFSHAFGWKARGYRSRNVTADRVARADVDAEVLDEIQRANRLDIRLHEFARQLFAQRVAAQPSGFAGELAILQSR